MAISEAVDFANRARKAVAKKEEDKLRSKPTPSGLGRVFKVKIKKHFNKNVTLNAKAFGQMKQLISKVGQTKVYDAMVTALDDWEGFLQYVKQEKNWEPDAKVPNVGFLLFLSDELKEYYLMNSGSKDVEDGDTTYATEDEVAANNANTIKNIWS